MAGPRRSSRLAAKEDMTPKPTKTVVEPQSQSRLMNLSMDVFYMIIEELEKGSVLWDYEGHLYQKRFQTRDLQKLSLVNKRLREILTPRLFQYARISDFPRSVRPGESRKRPPLYRTLKAMAKQPLIMKAIQYLILETKPVETTYHYNTPDALWKCLELMPNLKEISLRLRGSAKLMPLLESHIAHNPKLPVLNTVHSISIYADHSKHFSKFLKLTPNIKNASIEIPGCTRHCPQLLALSKLPQLEYLMLCRVVPRPRRYRPPVPLGWRILDVQAIADIVPNIKHLALVGQLEDDEDAPISEYIEVFTKFKKLERLDMTDEFVVDAEVVDDIMEDEYDQFDSEAGSEDSPPDEEFTAMAMAEDHYLNEERPKVARKFFEACPTLQKVYLTRCEDGQLFERGDEGSEDKITESLNGDTHEFPFSFPRVLKVNDTPRAPGPYY